MTLSIEKREDAEMVPMVLAPELECKKCGYNDVEIVCADGKTYVNNQYQYDSRRVRSIEPSEWRVAARLRILVRCNKCGELTGYGLGVQTTVEDGEDRIPWHKDLLEPEIEKYYSG